MNTLLGGVATYILQCKTWYNVISMKKDIQKKDRQLDTNLHSVFLLYYHLVLVVKYRRKVITKEISEYAKKMFVRIGETYNLTLVEWNYESDHVHVLFKAHPNSELTKFLNSYKSASSRLIKKDFPKVRQKLWKEYFWSRSFCLLTTGGVSIDVIKKYIENQGSGDDSKGI